MGLRGDTTVAYHALRSLRGWFTRSPHSGLCDLHTRSLKIIGVTGAIRLNPDTLGARFVRRGESR